MVSSSKLVAYMATLLFTQSLASVLPVTSEEVIPRSGGYPASNPPGTTCYNTWETVTNDPVVQYWYIVVPNSGGALKADRMWNHLNLNDCAPTENKYYSEPNIKGSAITFHASEACTAEAVSHAYRSSTSPPINIACAFTGKNSDIDPGEVAGSGLDAAIEGITAALGGD